MAPDESLDRLLEFIKTNRGFDFTGYKRPSLQRRIAKRMQLVGLDTYSDYLVHLETHPNEFAELFNTILINVTSFFRDPAAWESLAEEILPALATSRRADADIRIWIPGCASGEEAYTLAMLLVELLGEERFLNHVKIYATDLDEGALTLGRHGRYTSKALEPVPAQLRGRYFEEKDGWGTFRNDLRRCVIFGRHDLVQDPPISRIDLLVARNTLMYFTADTQGRVLGNFHFALRDDGYLFLGKSEVLLTRSNLFTPVDLKHRIFAKAERTSTIRDRLLTMVDESERPDQRRHDGLVRSAAFEMVPVAQLVVDHGGTLALANIHARTLFGLTQRDLGRPLQDLELSYRPVELRSLIDRSRSERHAVSLRDVEWRSGPNDVRFFDVQVAPLTSSDGSAVGTSISFQDVSRYKRLQDSLEESKAKLETAFEELQSTAEELETTNEELQSTNEELETTNEELQSTNEELETMNEELQSTNEELETMNDELRLRTHDLHEVNSFLESILVSLRAGVVVLDTELRVQAWNDEAAELWGLRSDEVEGQHFANLDIGLPVDDLLPLVRTALTSPAESSSDGEVVLEATNRRGRPFDCHVTISPLLSPAREVRGAILVMDAAQKPERE
jgi:two-component system, chemotaxis family, CheB/CheR fusion protein